MKRTVQNSTEQNSIVHNTIKHMRTYIRRRSKLNNDVLRELKREERELARLITRLENRLDKAPCGSLRVNGTKGRKIQFYQYIPENKKTKVNGTYLCADEHDVAIKLAQKGYDARLLEWAKRAESRIGNLIDSYEYNSPELIYNSLSNIRKELVTPYFLPDDQYIEAWERKWQLDKNTYKKKYSIMTQRGEQVRSKSEKIIADKLYTEGIPYVYEPEVLLENGECLYPDFAILNIRTRKEYLFEHFGKMDDEDYSRRNTKKIEDYALSGYTLGDNFLCTFETSVRTFSAKYLDLLVNKYLK